MNMTNDEERIRALIERWAEAVHAGDIGLRKEHGRWIVAHEHHSFPDA